jgi:hypothetical protein
MSNTKTTEYHPCGAEVTDENWQNCHTELVETKRSNEWAIVCTEHDVLISITNVRQATVDATKVGWGSDPLKVVNAYLPSNFQASQKGDVITITGTDNYGWTLTDYVIPRLASAMIFAQEVN